MHVQHIHLVPLQQVIKCITANPLDKLSLGFVDGDALQPVDCHRRELQSREPGVIPEEGWHQIDVRIRVDGK